MEKAFFTPKSRRRVERVGLYGRVSGKGQENNTSLSNQLDKTGAFALEHGLETVAEATEVVTGISQWGARTQFNQYLKMADRGLIDAIVVDVPDRLGRDDAIPVLIARAHDRDLEVLFVSKGGPLTSIDKALGMLASGTERKRIGERTKEGKMKSASTGGVPMPIAPFGYRKALEYDPRTGKKIGASVEFEPEEAIWYRKMYEWLIHEEESLHGIAARLHENRVFPPGLKKKLIKRYGRLPPWDEVPPHLVDSRRWSRGTLRRLLRNEIAIGHWHYNRQITTSVEGADRMEGVRLGIRDREEWIAIETPALVSEDVFERAQAILSRNQKRLAGRKPKTPYLLRGMLFCACGRRMVLTSGGESYRCGKEKKCPYPALPRRLAEDVVWDHVRWLLGHPDVLLAQYEQKREEAAERNVVLMEQMQNLLGEVSEAEIALETALDMRLKQQMDQATYARKKKEIEGGIRGKKFELLEVEKRLEWEDLGEDDKRAFKTFCERMAAEAWADPPLEEKRKTLLRLNVTVINAPHDRALKIEGYFPDTTAHFIEFEGLSPEEEAGRWATLPLEKPYRLSQQAARFCLPFSAVLPLAIPNWPQHSRVEVAIA